MQVLFICKYNAGRSRMAEAFFNRFSKNDKACSAGIGDYPKSFFAKIGLWGTIRVMKEVGIAIPKELGRGVTQEDVDRSDLIVILLSKDQWKELPVFVARSSKTVFYELPDANRKVLTMLRSHRLNRVKIEEMASRIAMTLDPGLAS